MILDGLWAGEWHSNVNDIRLSTGVTGIGILAVPLKIICSHDWTRRRVAAIAAAIVCAVAGDASAATAKLCLTLPQAVEMALKQNAVLKIGRAKVSESEQKVVSTRAQYFPLLSNNTKYMALSEKQLVSVPAGSLGSIPGVGPFPPEGAGINQGSSTMLLSETTLAQPTTQLLKIAAANRIARADRGIAKAELRRSENDTVFAVYQLYYALLIASREREAAQAMLTAAQETLKESEDALRAGNVLEVAVTGARASLLQARQSLLAAEVGISDLTSDLDDRLGLPVDTSLEVTAAGLAEAPPLPSKEHSYQMAVAENGERVAAHETVAKSRHAVQAARYEYIPDVTIFARHEYQDGAPFLTHNLGIFGAELTWNIFDWGKRRGEIGQRLAQLAQAEENLARVDKRLEVEINKAYRKLERTRQMVDVAREALALRSENVRLSENGVKAGTVTAAKHAEAVAALRKAEMEELQASLQCRLAQVEIARIEGTLAQSH